MQEAPFHSAKSLGNTAGAGADVPLATPIFDPSHIQRNGQEKNEMYNIDPGKSQKTPSNRVDIRMGQWGRRTKSKVPGRLLVVAWRRTRAQLGCGKDAGDGGVRQGGLAPSSIAECQNDHRGGMQQVHNGAAQVEER